MSKIDPLVSVSGGLTTAATLNVNFQAIEDAFQNTLSLDGSTPNEMAADLSMGHNRIINVADAEQATDAVNLSQFQALITSDPGAIALRADLLAAGGGDGADIIGYLASGTGATPRTLLEKVREIVSFADFATPQEALDSGAKLVTIPEDYTVVSPSAGLVVPAGVSVWGSGDSSVIDGTGVAFGEAAIIAEGSVAASTTLTGNVTEFENVLPLTSVSGISVGTWLNLRSTVDNSWSGFRTYRKQSFYKVVAISGLNVTLNERTATSFESASTAVDILSPTTASFKDFKVLAKTSDNGNGLLITYGLDCVVENVNCVGGVVVGLGASQSINTTFRKCTSFLTAAAVDTQYALAATSSDRTRFEECTAYGTRHAVAVVGDQCRRTTVSGCHLSGGRPADIHGCGDGTQYINCSIHGGITLGGRNTRYINCDVYAPQDTGTNADAIVVIVSEIVSGYQEIIGGTYSYDGATIAVGWSPFDLGRGNGLINTDVMGDFTFRFRDFTINYPNLGGNLMRAQNTSNYKMNFDIQGLTINMPTAANVVRYEGVAGGADADFVIVDGISHNSTASPYPLFKQGAGALGYATTPMRLQSCQVTTSLSVLSADVSKATTFSYPYEYHNTPQVNYSYQGSRNPSGVAGNEIYHNLTAVGVTSATVTYTCIDAGAFGADFTAATHFRVGVNEL